MNKLNYLLMLVLIFSFNDVQALSLELSNFTVSHLMKGESASIIATINVQDNEIIDFDELFFITNGSTTDICIFDINSFLLTETGCEGIDVSLIDDTTSAINGEGYMYGEPNGFNESYGYTNGNLIYNITIETTYFNPDVYKFDFRTSLDIFNYSSSFRILSILSDINQYLNESIEIIQENINNLILGPEGYLVQKVIVPSTNTGQVNLSLTAVQNSTKQVSLTNEFTLTRESTVNYTAVIPASTVIDGGSAWDGKLTLPQVVSSSAFSVASGTVDVAVEMGSTVELNFSQAVKVVIGGMAGKKAAWARGTGALTSIDTVCDSLTAPTNIDKNTVRECYINDGNDLVIWTYHFTTFSAYTPSAITTSSRNSGGGGSGGGSFNQVSNSITYNYVNNISPIVNKELIKNDTPNNYTSLKPRTARGFTGRVIFDENGNLTGTAWTGLIVLIAVVAGLVTYSRMRKQKKEEEKIDIYYRF